MSVALKEDYQRALDEQKKEVRGLVMAGLEQINEGRTKDFNTVCDKLEKKYRQCCTRDIRNHLTEHYNEIKNL